MVRSTARDIVQLLLFAAIAAGLVYFLRDVGRQNKNVTPPLTAAAVESAVVATSSANAEAASTTQKRRLTMTTSIAKIAHNKAMKSSSATSSVVRLERPWTGAALSASEVNARARSALVNILCLTDGSLVKPISGSGVIIDPRGVILTNAHVAQYVLLSESPAFQLHCIIRRGSPAIAMGVPKVLYIPPVWVMGHVSEILEASPRSTGEHDYALLWISSSVDDSPLPASFPAVAADTRDGVALEKDEVLIASYPAEFLGGLAAANSLYAATSITTIKQLMTFIADTIDELSLGGVIEAQGGSSGGAVVNAAGSLVGLIVTASEAETTDKRDLRALTLSYVSHDLKSLTGFDLPTTLGGDPSLETEDFTRNQAQALIELYIKQLRN